MHVSFVFLLRREFICLNYMQVVFVVTFGNSVVYLFMYGLLFTCFDLFKVTLRRCVSDGRFLSHSHRSKGLCECGVDVGGDE